MVLENIHSFARNQAKTINKFLCANRWIDRTNKLNYKNVYLLLYEL
jgi:hypothetical protein